MAMSVERFASLVPFQRSSMIAIYLPNPFKSLQCVGRRHLLLLGNSFSQAWRKFRPLKEDVLQLGAPIAFVQV